MDLNWIDGICAFAALVLSVLGAWAGLVRSLFRLTALAGGVAGVWMGSPILREILSQNIAGLQPWALYGVSWSLGFLGPWLAIMLLGSLSDKVVKASPLNLPNRLGGALLGLLKAAALAYMLAGLLEKLPLQGALLAQRESSLWMYFHRSWGPVTLPQIKLPADENTYPPEIDAQKKGLDI